MPNVHPHLSNGHRRAANRPERLADPTPSSFTARGGPAQDDSSGRTDQATHSPAACRPPHQPADHPRAGRDRPFRSWPLALLAAPAAAAVWSGWVGIGQMTGFGQVHPLPGIWDALHLNTAVTLPIGVEAYAAYALRAWLSPCATVSATARRFARWSAITALLLGMAGQIAYHLLTQAGTTRAPWEITTAVSCLPVLVLGMGAALAHLLGENQHEQARHAGHEASTHPHNDSSARLARARAIAGHLIASGQRVSRRTLRAAGIKGSNADLAQLARALRNEPHNGNRTSGRA
jgi:hypothetical protein